VFLRFGICIAKRGNPKQTDAQAACESYGRLG